MWLQTADSCSDLLGREADGTMNLRAAAIRREGGRDGGGAESEERG